MERASLDVRQEKNGYVCVIRKPTKEGRARKSGKEKLRSWIDVREKNWELFFKEDIAVPFREQCFATIVDLRAELTRLSGSFTTFWVG